MKTIIFTALSATAMISALSGSAFAGEICGTLGTHVVAPQCAPDAMCPMFMRLQYDLTTTDGTRYNLDTSSVEVLDNFGQLRGNNVCVEGKDAKDSIEVTTVTAQQSE
jgi:hypothetical protein